MISLGMHSTSNSVSLVLFEPRAILICLNFTIIRFINLRFPSFFHLPPTYLSYLLLYVSPFLIFLYLPVSVFTVLSSYRRSTSTGDSKITEALLQQLSAVSVEALHYCTVFSTYCTDTHTPGGKLQLVCRQNRDELSISDAQLQTASQTHNDNVLK